MRITSQNQKVVSQQIEDVTVPTSPRETSIPQRETSKISYQNASTPEIDLLSQMVQSVLQNSLPPNWETLIREALENLTGEEFTPEFQNVKNSDTQSRLMAETLNKQLSSGEFADLSAAAKKLAEEMKQKPALPASGGFGAILTYGAETMKQKRALQEKAIGLMEQAKTPEQYQEITEHLGGTDFKHELVDAQHKDRLTQTAQKNQMPDQGFTLSAEQLSKNAEKIEKADGDKTVELSKDTELLRNASPEQKIKMIKELGKGFDGHDDKKCIAIDRILSSCKSKAEFDKVLDGAGGKELLTKLNGDEAKKRVNELCGMWGRMDAATMPEVAKKFENLMTDPAKQAEYSAVRPPSSDETKNVGANMKSSPPDPAFEQAEGRVKENMSNKAFSAEWDQGSKVELIREQRRRELSGDPKLDYTSVVAQSEKITNASDDEIRAYKKKKPDEKISDDDRKDYIKEKMEALRKQTGLSEQSINDLVTRKMGNIYAQGAAELSAHGQHAVGELQKQYAQVVSSKGADSPEAQQLKSRIETLSKNFEANGKKLAQTSQTYHELFPMPPSFSEMVGKVFGAIGDIAASVFKMVPGWGQAFSGIYTAAKSIGQGDLLGGIAGFGGMIAGPGYKEACNFIQRSSRGDLLDAFGNLSKDMGGAIGQEAIKLGKNIEREDWNAVAGQLSQGAAMLVGAGGVSKVAAEVAQKGIDTARAAAKIVDGINKGDGFTVLGGMAEAAGAFANVKGAAGEIAKYASVGINTAKGVGMMVDAASKGDVANVLTGLNNAVSGISHLAGSKSPMAGVLGYTQNVTTMLEKFSRGDVVGGMMMGIGLTSPLVKEQGVRNLLDTVQGSLPAVQKILQGNLSTVGPLTTQLGIFSGDIQKFVSNPDIQKFIVSAGQSPALFQSVQKGDVFGVVNSLTQKGGMLQTLGGEQFAKVIDDVGKHASQILNSSEMKQVTKLTETGTKIMQSLSNGKPEEAIRMFTGGVFLPQLQSLVPLAQSMARGDFNSALKQLAQNPQTRALANQLHVLQPLVNLTQGTALSNLQNFEHTLRHIAYGSAQAGAGAMNLGMNVGAKVFRNIQHETSLDEMNQMLGKISPTQVGHLNQQIRMLERHAQSLAEHW
jgi:hypothetical protein